MFEGWSKVDFPGEGIADPQCHHQKGPLPQAEISVMGWACGEEACSFPVGLVAGLVFLPPWPLLSQGLHTHSSWLLHLPGTPSPSPICVRFRFSTPPQETAWPRSFWNFGIDLIVATNYSIRYSSTFTIACTPLLSFCCSPLSNFRPYVSGTGGSPILSPCSMQIFNKKNVRVIPYPPSRSGHCQPDVLFGNHMSRVGRQ